jgi:hemoglobin
MSEPSSATQSLFQWAGGEPAIRRLMDCFYDRVEGDELLSPYFPGGVSEDHRAHVAAWWSEVFGGPARYTEELGGYESMLAHHRGLTITPEERLRFVSLLSLAADDAGLPADPEFRSALMAYAEWGSRLAMHNSQPGAEAAQHAPVPRWGWGEAPPFQPSSDESS